MKQKGFEQLLEETHAKVTQLEQPLAVIDTMLTLDGKIPLEIARQSLNFEQWAIYQHLAHGTCLFTDEVRFRASHQFWNVSLWSSSSRTKF